MIALEGVALGAITHSSHATTCIATTKCLALGLATPWMGAALAVAALPVAWAVVKNSERTHGMWRHLKNAVSRMQSILAGPLKPHVISLRV